MYLLFFLLWLAFNARITAETVLIGAFLSGVVYWFVCRHMGYRPETDRKILRKLLRGVQYLFVLIWETMKANMEVSRVVFSKTIEVEPQLVFFHTDLKTQTARVVLANSITLTPGTITVSLLDGEYCVHCLKSHMADGIDQSAFVRRLKMLEED